jgi:hypothetical protein
MILRVELKVFTNTSFFTIGVSLDLPSQPTTASRANSAWRLNDLGVLSIESGFCISQTVKHAFPDQLWLANIGPDRPNLSGRMVQGDFVVGIVLWEFFGFDGGIRETGEAFVNPKLGVLPGRHVEWSIEPGQSYKRSLADYPTGDFPTPPERVRNTA